MPNPRSQLNDVTELAAPQTLELATETLQSHLPLVFDSPLYVPDDTWHVLILAAAQGRSIDSAPVDLADAPAPNTVRYQLRTHLFADHDLVALEQRLNEALVAKLPPGIQHSRQRIAMDLTLIPYHGQPAKDPNEIRRGEAKSGTTHFHVYASAYLKHHHPAAFYCALLNAQPMGFYPPASLVRDGQRRGVEVLPPDVNQSGAKCLKALDIEPKRLYLDRQFFSVELLRLLQVKPFTTILPVPVRGKRLRSLFKGRQSYATSYEVRSPKYGNEEIAVYVVARYAKGRRGKHRVEHLPYAVIGQFDRPVSAARQEHRARFGIESSYRLGNALRPRTSSRDPKLRLLLVGLSAILVNLWVWLRWTAASILRPGPGRRSVREDLLRLSRLRTFLTLAVQAIHGVVTAIRRPTSRKAVPRQLSVHSSLTFAEY